LVKWQHMPLQSCLYNPNGGTEIVDAFFKCLLAAYLSILPGAGDSSHHSGHLVSNQTVAQSFNEHKRQIYRLVAWMNFESMGDRDVNPADLLSRCDQEDLMTLQEVGIKNVSMTGYLSRVGLEVDRTATTRKEIVWKPSGFRKYCMGHYDKAFDVVSLDDNWGIVTTPLN
jgi:hypothetical protein